MKDYVILTDVTCDLKKEIRERFDIEYIKGHIILPDKSEKVSSLEWDWISRDDFYNSLKKKNVTYSTAPANIAEYAEVFKKYAAEGKDVLSISISTGLSGTFAFSSKAAEEVMAEYPDTKIICIDSLRYSALLGLLCVYASENRKSGMTIEENAAWLNENKNKFHQMGWLDDLSFVARQGRLTNAQAFFGTLVGIKPLGDIDYNGLTTVIGKAKGEKAAYAAILGYIEETIVDPQNQIMFVATSMREKQALVLKQLVEEKFKPKEVIITQVYPGCGINVGPGLMCAFYMGQPISEGLETEKALMTKLLAAK